MRSVFNRMKDASVTSRMCAGRLFIPDCLPVAQSMFEANFVAMTTLSRTGASASPTSSSLVKGAVDLGGIEERHAAVVGHAASRHDLLSSSQAPASGGQRCY
jgi:hypothetical protein